MNKKVKLTESELTGLIKRILNEQGAILDKPNKPISFDTLYEYMYNSYTQKNNKGVSVNLTFDGTQVIATLETGAKMPLTK